VDANAGRVRALTAAVEGGTRLQERLEATDLGRVVISALIVVVITANLPASWLQSKLTKVATPAINGTGLVQVWGVFAPDPRRESVDLEARVRMTDGSVQVWHDPAASKLFGDYSVYRWRKYMEWAVADAYMNILWRPTTIWLARRAVQEGRHPVSVTLIRRWSRLYPPGSSPAQSRWHQSAYYRLRVTPAVLEEIRA
jgi:hypothetical protein